MEGLGIKLQKRRIRVKVVGDYSSLSLEEKVNEQLNLLDDHEIRSIEYKMGKINDDEVLRTCMITYYL